MSENYYQILGVPAEATPRQIRAAFRRRAREVHPDVSGRGSEAFLQLFEAYSVLSQPERRRQYDRQLAAARAARAARTLHPSAPAEPLITARPAPETFTPTGWWSARSGRTGAPTPLAAFAPGRPNAPTGALLDNFLNLLRLW